MIKLKTPQYLCLLAFLLLASSVQAMDRRGRLGIGYSSQMKNSVPGVSFKLQKSRSFAFGGVFGIDTDDTSGGYGAGLKFYRNLFDEPQLHFYTALLGGIINQKTSTGNDSGFQFDITVGSEFSFSGLQSLGFSFETGFSFYKIKEFTIETVGHSFFVAGIHFYI